jgi:hypothetical protein
MGEPTRDDADDAHTRLFVDIGSDAADYLLGLFGAKEVLDLPKRQLGEFIRLAQFNASEFEDYKKVVHADNGPPAPEYQDVVEAAAALRKRIGDEAVRSLLRLKGVKELSDLRHYHVDTHRELIRLSRLGANTIDEFRVALAEATDDVWSREAKAPLPDDLQVLALEYRCEQTKLEPAIEVLRTLGCVTSHSTGETTLFGRKDHSCLRLDVIAKRPLMEKWLSSSAETQHRFGSFCSRDLMLRHISSYLIWRIAIS